MSMRAQKSSNREKQPMHVIPVQPMEQPESLSDDENYSLRNKMTMKTEKR